MQNVSNLYSSIVSGEHWFEWKLDIDGGISIPESQLFSVKTNCQMFPGSPKVGQAMSGEIDVKILTPTLEITRMAALRPYARACNATQQSEWIPKGFFYIDTRDQTKDSRVETIEIHGFDAMLKMSQQLIPTGTPSGQWPRPADELMEEIAQRIGVELDPRSNLQPYPISYPGSNLTIRQVAGYIAGMHGGNWVISDSGKLRLVPLSCIGGFHREVISTQDGVPILFGNTFLLAKPLKSDGESVTITDLGQNVADLSVSKQFAPFSGVRLIYDDKETYFAGNENGRVLEIECPWGSQDIADSVLEKIKGRFYQPYTAQDALLDPAMELGDTIIIDGYESTIASMETTFDALYTANISAPADEEIDHEYPYTEPVPPAVRREISQTKAEITVGLDSINARVENEVAGLHSEISQTVNSIRATVVNDGDGRHATLELWVDGADKPFTTAKILMDGNVSISGELSADALYAAFGEVANLEVDRLSTARKIVKYLAQNTGDDSYIDIRGEKLCLISSVYAGGEEQATNPRGVLLYWEDDPNGEGVTIGPDGYPYKDNVRIFTKTEETPWPVMVYTYNEDPKGKARFAFEKSEQGYDVPVLTLGVGNPQGNDIARLVKGVEKLELLYKAQGGKEIGLVAGYDGWIDLYGLRKTKRMDFSAFDEGRFSEVLSGDIEVNYSVDFDSMGQPIRISDGLNSVEVVW